MLRRYRMSIFMTALALGAAAWGIVGLAEGHVGPAVFGFPMMLIFASVALINSPRGIERGYYRSVYRVLTLGRGQALRNQ